MTITGGQVSFDASQMSGTDEELLALLEEFATDLGGNPQALKVEKHVQRPNHTHVAKTATVGKK